MDVDHFCHVLVSNHTHICDDYPACNHLEGHCLLDNHRSDHPFDNHPTYFDPTDNGPRILANHRPEIGAFVDFDHLGGHHVALSTLLEPRLC